MTHPTLVQGPLRLTVDPIHGGVIRRFSFAEGAGRTVELMRPMPDGSSGPLDAASFPLVPFSNRIGHARFRFDGRDVALNPNFPPEPHFIHGHGWGARWEVTAIDDDSCTIGFSYPGGDWPWVYRASQTFTLTDTVLSVRLTLTNLDPRPMPAGLGLHPYFVKEPDSRLHARVEHMWTADPTKLPVERVPVDPKGPPLLEIPNLDNSFGGWDGTALIEWPRARLALAIEADPLFGHLVVYVPRGEDFFCAEPVSHANDAVNLVARGVPATGLRVLQPNESLAGTVRFRVAPMSRAGWTGRAAIRRTRSA